MSESRISGLYRQTVAERIDELQQRGWLSEADTEVLHQGRHVLRTSAADRMIENVIGVFGLPLAIAPNFVVNGRGHLVPMAIEEPSVVAALSNAARLSLATGGFVAACDESLLAGQVHVANISNAETSLQVLLGAKDELIRRANEVHPRLVRRGGGVRDIEVRRVQLGNTDEVIAVHFLVDTCDAMGANLVNTLCEAMAPLIAELCGGDVKLRILSNLADRSLVRATVHYQPGDLATTGYTADAVRDGIVMASDIAAADHYRAATHNKGVMNGVDALALATGNDWRAIEAGAHAYAARDGRYAPLATWSVDEAGDLRGEICLPLKVATTGGTLAANPAAQLALRITGVESARELAELMAAVGLAQNFAAIRALATRGIQEGHMRLHARSSGVSAAADVGSVSRGKDAAAVATAAGKIILLGEHAAVYGRHALAVPIVDAVTASVRPQESVTTLKIPEWGVDLTVDAGKPPFGAIIALIRKELGIGDGHYRINLNSRLPRSMGLGSSASLAVAVVRAFGDELGLDLDDQRINEIAFACEKLAHGTPSGLDNTMATFAEPMLFRNTDTLHLRRLDLSAPPPLVIAYSSRRGSTKEQVEAVRRRHDGYPAHYDALFDEIDALSQAGATALVDGDYADLGELMNLCHGILNAIGVSTPELEAMISIARAAGAAGAKLTGSGGGGSIVALSPGATDEVAAALEAAGFETFTPATRGT